MVIIRSFIAGSNLLLNIRCLGWKLTLSLVSLSIISIIVYMLHLFNFFTIRIQGVPRCMFVNLSG